MILESNYNICTENTIRAILNKEYPNDMWVFKKIKKDSNIPSVFYVTIKGDWKHHHSLTDEIMKAHGFAKIGEKSIWQSTNDCYKSTHIYATQI